MVSIITYAASIFTGAWASLISDIMKAKITDGERAEKALKGFEGKRLTYKATGSQGIKKKV